MMPFTIIMFVLCLISGNPWAIGFAGAAVVFELMGV